MSAWSSSTGKAQLSYADRLRQASKSTAPVKQDPPPSASFATRAVPQEPARTSPPSASLSAAGAPSRRLSSASSAGAAAAATVSGGAPRPSATPSDNRNSPASSESSAAPLASSGPPVNVWEARRKQLADREAEKERERQAALAQQKRAAPAVTATSSANVTPNKPKQAPATPRKGNERHSKGSTASNQSDRKPTKTNNQTPTRASNSVSIASSTPTTKAAPITDKAAVPTTASKANHGATPTKSAKIDNQSAEGAGTVVRPDEASAAAQSKQASSDSTSKSKVDDSVSNNDTAKAPAKQHDQAANASTSAQSAAAQVPPSSALSVQTGSAQPFIHDDVPGSPATVASAIEEVLKNGVANGGQTEEDDAWLARIHLLNGGQNMPKFGGFGPNGVSGLSDEAEMQAAKKAERAVAAAWGAGKSVWNKSQQSRADVSKDTASASSPGDVAKDPSQATNADSKDSAPAVPPAAVNGTSTGSKDASASASKESQKAAAVSGEKPEATVADASIGKQKSRAPLDQQKPGKGATTQSKASTANVPPFEDVNNWPSPLDAGKKLAEKPRVAVGSSDQDKSDAGKASQSKTPKSLYETLDELQVRIAPGANPQQPGGAAGARKGKQQWVSILPEITHTSTPAGGAKINRPQLDVKAGKGANKQQQQRKDANKGAGQTHQGAQGGKKDGGNKPKAARAEDKAQAKEGAVDASSGNKASDPRGKEDARGLQATQGDKAGGAAANKSNARSTDAHSTPAKPFTPNSQSQPQDAEQTQTKSAESASASTEKQAGSAPSSTPSARGELPAKQPQHTQQARTNLRPNLNGVPPHPNGVRAPKSGASSGTGTPVTNRSSPRGSVASSPKVHALPRAAAQLSHDSISTPYAAVQPPPLFYGPSGAATPMLAPGPPTNHAAPWLPYNPYARPAPAATAYMFDATAQTGAPLPAGVLGQLLGQIEFYFSQHNLQGDFFLRQKMDAQGWVDIAVVAGFKRVQAITADLGTVKDALLHSAVLDVDELGMRVRRRWGWELYTLAPAASSPAPEVAEKAAEGATEKQKEVEKPTPGGGEEDEEALGVVAASGFGGALEA